MKRVKVQSTELFRPHRIRIEHQMQTHFVREQGYVSTGYSRWGRFEQMHINQLVRNLTQKYNDLEPEYTFTWETIPRGYWHGRRTNGGERLTVSAYRQVT